MVHRGQQEHAGGDHDQRRAARLRAWRSADAHDAAGASSADQRALRPTVSGARQSNSLWRAGNGLAKLTKKRKIPIGTTFSFVLNEPSSVSLTFTQRVGGRKVRGSCKAQGKSNRHKPACKRTVTAGAIVLSGHAGLNKVAFQGRISASKKLRPGSYALGIVARAAGKASSPATLRFTIVKR